MPLLDDDGSMVASNPGTLPQEHQTYHPGYFESLRSAFSLENSIGSSIRAATEPELVQGPFDKQYDPISDPEIKPYVNTASDWQYFITAQNKEQALDLAHKKQEEIDMDEGLAAAGWKGTAARFTAGLFDPLMFVPVGGEAIKGAQEALKAGELLRASGKSAVALAQAGALSTTAQEAVLQGTQNNRSIEQSLYNIGGATLMTGVLGAAFPFVAKAFKSGAPDVVKAFENDVMPKTKEGETFSARIDPTATHTESNFTLPKEAYPVEGEGNSTVGAASVKNTTIEQEGIASALGMEKVTAFSNPIERVLSSETLTGRRLIQDLTRIPFMLKKNLEGIRNLPSVFEHVEFWDKLRGDAKDVMTQQYTKYRTGVAAGRMAEVKLAVGDAYQSIKGQRQFLNRREFEDEIGKSMARGDAHAIPEVAAVAQHLREKIFNPILERGVQANLWPEELKTLPPKTAMSYITRVYDKQKIIGDYNNFHSKVLEWLKNERDKSKASIEPAKADVKRMKETIKQKEKQVVVAQDAARTAVLASAEKNITDAVNEAMAQIKLEGDKAEFPKKTPEQAAAQAKKVSNQKQLDVLHEELSKELASIVDDATKEASDQIVSDVVKEFPEIEGKEVFDFIKQELAKPVGEAATDSAAGEVNARLKDAMQKANAEAVKSFQRSLKSQLTRMAKAGPMTEAEWAKKFIQKVKGQIRFEAMSAARKAAQESAPEIKEEIKKLVKEFKDKNKELGSHINRAKFMDEELRTVADDIIQNRILSTPEGALAYSLGEDAPGRIRSGSGGKSSLFKARSWAIPDEIVEPWLVRNASEVMDSYVRKAIPEIELTMRGLDDAGFEKQLQDINTEFGALKEKAKVVQPGKIAGKVREMKGRTTLEEHAADVKKRLDSLEAQRKGVIRDLTAVRDQVKGTYGMPADPTSPFLRVGQVARKMNLVSKLADVVLSSLTDIARPVMTQGISNVMRHGLVPFFRDFKAANLSRVEAGELASVAEMSLNTRFNRNGDIFDIYANHTKFERGVNAMTQMYGPVTLISHWNQLLKEWTAMIARSRIIQESHNWTAGTIGDTEKGLMAASFIDRRLAKKIADITEKVDGVWVFKNGADDMEVSKVMRAALQREVNTTVVTPSPGQTALWTKSSAIGKLIGQFRSFTLSSAQSVMLAGLQRRDSSVLAGMLLATGVGVTVNWLKAIEAGRELQGGPASWVADGIDRAGITGWFFDVDNIMEKMTNNRMGIRPMLGAAPSTRYASRNQVGALFGPSFGLMADVWKVGGDMVSGDWTTSDTHAMRKMIPFQNLFYLRNILNKAEDGVNSAFGVEEKQ